MSDEQIRQTLVGMGWDAKSIDEAITGKSSEPSFVPPEQKPAVNSSPAVNAPAEPAKPVQSVQPMQPVAKPAEPMQQPASPVAQSIQPVAAQPIQPAQQPQPQSAPAEPALQPLQPIRQPEAAKAVDFVSPQPVVQAQPMQQSQTMAASLGQSMPVQTASYTPPSGGGKKKGLVIGVLAVLIILAGGLAYAYTKKLLFFAPNIADEKLFAGIPDALSRIDTESYSASVAVEARPRENGAKAYVEVPFPEYNTMKDAYDRDIKTISNILVIFQSLETYQNAHKAYPKSLEDLKNQKAPSYAETMLEKALINPKTQKPYDYEPVEQSGAGYKAFILTVELETQQAVSTVSDYYKTLHGIYDPILKKYVPSAKPDITGQTISFNEHTSAPYYIYGSPKKPLPMEFFGYLQNYSQYLPASFSADLKTYGVADFSTPKTTDTKSGWAVDVSLGDFNASVDVDFVKKGDTYYFKINKAPAIFFDFTNIKGKWVKISPDDFKGGSQFMVVPFDPSQIGKFVSSSSDQKQKSIEQAKLLYALAINDGALVATPRSSASGDPENSRHFSVAFKKENMSRFYKDAADELGQRYGADSPIHLNDLDTKYFNSDSFSNLFDYLKDNNSFDLWIDKTDGFPVKFSYTLRLVPDDSAPKLKDVEYVMTSTFGLTDINKPIAIEEPAGAISYTDAVGILTGRSGSQLTAESRDSNRISDVGTLKSAISLYLADVTGPVLCQKGKIYKSTNGTDATDGTGWVPVNFNAISSGPPISKLPKDPINDSKYFYSYACDPANLNFELNANMESQKYGKGGPSDVSNSDGGDNPSVYETGTALNILH